MRQQESTTGSIVRRMNHSLMFLREFMRNPGTVGAVLPSSPQLAAEIVRQARVRRASVILEFGAGTGAFTRAILDCKSTEARFVAVEFNEALCQVLRTQFPEAVIVHDSVENAPAILEAQGIGPAECIVSGLPWAAFEDALQDRLLQATLNVLAPGGRFTTFAYLQGLMLPAGKRFRRKIEEHFSRVHVSRVVWRNFPAAVVYCCRK